MTRSRTSFLAVLTLFAASGFAGLLYEVAWTRELRLVFGSAEVAVATVLAAYLGGLGLGAAVAGPRVSRTRRPLLAYGLLELGVAVAALLVPLGLRAARGLLVLAFGSRPEISDASGPALAAFELFTSFAVLIVPTALMGATLPLLARHGVERDDEVGSRVGALYAANTAGAVVGAVTAGFVLLPSLGLARTVWVAVAANLLVLLGVLALSPRVPEDAAGDGPAAATGASWVLPALFVSGVVSLTYEVFWTRLLGHLLGGGTEAFATMLAAFLAGIALGSAVAAPLARSAASARIGFVVAQIGIALLSLASYAALDALPTLAPLAERGPWLGAAVAALALLPGAACVGATFPFAVRALAPDARSAAPAAGRAYAWNTLGAIVGATAAAFVLLPRLGFQGTLACAVGANLAVAAAAAWLVAPRAVLPGSVALACLALLVALPPVQPWRILAATPLRPMATGRVVFHAVGRNATVLVAESEGEWSVRGNGLPEESIQPPGLPPARHLTTRWLGTLPTLVRPGARSLLVVGLGGGVSLESVPAGIQRLDVVEIEPEVVRANRAVAGLRWRDPLADPRVRLRIGDARTALALTSARFDAIVSQPSHPWTASSSLYTREFFLLCRDHLGPDGVFVQWIGVPYLDETLLRSLVATLRDVFPHVDAYLPPGTAELIFVASTAPLPLPSADAIRAAGPELAAIGISVPEDLAAALVMDAERAGALAVGAPLNTDAHNRLEGGSLRALRRGEPRSALDLLQASAGAGSVAPGVDRLRLVRRLLENGRGARARLLAESFSQPAERAAAQGLVAVSGGDVGLGQRLLDQALASDPSLVEARGMRLRLARAALGRGEPPPERLGALTAAERAVADGWRAADASDDAGLRRLEAGLASVDATHPLFAEAARLRAVWRLAGGEPERVREARSILDVLLVRDGLLDDTLMRAAASLQLGDPRAALAVLSDVSWRVAADPRREELSRPLLRLLDQFPPREDLEPWKSAVRSRLGRP
jgi:spermidine synthase